MTKDKLFGFLFLLLCRFLFAQNTPIVPLKEVIVSDVQLKKYSNSQSLITLNDSVIQHNKVSLTSLLNYNSFIYFKEYGLGMISSPSFRGTTASQTAVIWNGININSQFNGQIDFNTLSGQNFNSVEVRPGGGSAIYGSSAIGGSVHLNSHLRFTERFQNKLLLEYGSFNTFNLNYNVELANKNVSTQISLSKFNSDNDYPYLETEEKNENGQFDNTTLNINFGFKLGTNNSLRFYSFLFESERHLSGTLASRSKNKYVDLNFRHMIEWVGKHNQFVSTFKTAFLNEGYKYFENANSPFFSYGESNAFIFKYDLAYHFNKKIEFNTIIDYNFTKGKGSDVGNNDRKTGSIVTLMKHQVFKKLLYELAVRKEFSDLYNTPILFSVGINYQPFRFYHIKLNGSKNYRIPTFNDLFWSNLGDINLNPESSIQAEIGNVFSFKNFDFSITSFYNDIESMIIWAPQTAVVWRPLNIGKVSTYGSEFWFNFKKKYQNNQLDFTSTYAYTVSKNRIKSKQLIYVPYHKFTAAMAYTYSNLSFFYQYMYTGEVFTSPDNFYSLDDFWVSNVGLNYRFLEKSKIQLGFKVLNIFNHNYQNIEVRPMPGRNYSINLIFNF